MDTSNESSKLKPRVGRYPTVSLISLGCPRTLVDSEGYLGLLKQAGFRVTDKIEGSDAVVINTCGFVQDAIEESIETVLQAVKLKKEGKVGVVVVAGCLVGRFKQELLDELPDVDGFIGVEGFDDIENVIMRALSGERPASIRSHSEVSRRRDRIERVALCATHYGYLKISEGCLRGCSFCVIPKIKGPLRSQKIETVLDEARSLVEERGVKELIVVGQDTSDYGVDLYGRARIAELLKNLARINGIEWIRLLYCHPHGITKELIETVRDEPVICKYLDMAIEHSDDDVLRRMNRKITQKELRSLISTLRDEIPGIALRTSVIVGFPGETEAAFEGLLRFLKEVRFERLGAFQYSNEEGSAAFGFPEQVPESVKIARFDRVMKMQQEVAQEINVRAVGKRCKAVIDERVREDPHQFLGRTQSDCPEVDGIIHIRCERELKAGMFVDVEITDSYEYDLVGRVLDCAGEGLR